MDRCPPANMVGDFVITSQVVNFGLAGAAIISEDPNRVTIAFSTQEAVGSFQILPYRTPGLTEGFQPGQTLLPFVFTYRDFGPMVGAAWFQQNGGGLHSVTITTVSYRPASGQ